MKLGLGTVQFGMKYGAFNNKGQVKTSEVKNIFNYCLQEGINTIDTAASYGESENVVGISLPINGEFRIITKTPHFCEQVITLKDVERLKSSFLNSLQLLGKQRVYGLLIHNADDLLTKNGSMLFKEMMKFKKLGLVEKIGVSVYNENQIYSILSKFNIDMIQLPINVLDQRLIKSGTLKIIKEKGIEIHARSIFLQGLILTDPIRYPSYFHKHNKELNFFEHKLIEMSVSRLQIALGFIKHVEEIDVALVGTESLMQLHEIVKTYNRVDNLLDVDYTKFAIEDENIINPLNWKI